MTTVVQWERVAPGTKPPPGLDQLTIQWIMETGKEPPQWILRFYRWRPPENGQAPGRWEPEMSAEPIPEQGLAVGEVRSPGERYARRLVVIQVRKAP